MGSKFYLTMARNTSQSVRVECIPNLSAFNVFLPSFTRDYLVIRNPCRVIFAGGNKGGRISDVQTVKTAAAVVRYVPET